MATWSKAGLYQNAQSASYLPLTLVQTVLKCPDKNIYATEIILCM